MKIALTGATGFVGGHLLHRLVDARHDVRALTRRPRDPEAGVEWIAGDLADHDALARLVEDCDAVIHVAGVLNAPDRAGFEAGNIAGTAAMIEAATTAGVHRFVHVSSLAAREPKLSLYGESKTRSEALVTASPLPFAIVRPPAVYGPGDRETLDLFRMAKKGVVLMPPAGRLSLIHVDDLARLLVTLTDPAIPTGLTIEPDDGQPHGYSHREFSTMLGAAVGRRVVSLSTPRAILGLAAAIDKLVRGAKAKLTTDRIAYFCHPDWVVSPTHPAPDEWAPRIDTHEGLADTADWYRTAGWL
jgi:nucleoside-diphosphate-sugar epimerase